MKLKFLECLSARSFVVVHFLHILTCTQSLCCHLNYSWSPRYIIGQNNGKQTLYSFSLPLALHLSVFSFRGSTFLMTLQAADRRKKFLSSHLFFLFFYLWNSFLSFQFAFTWIIWTRRRKNSSRTFILPGLIIIMTWRHTQLTFFFSSKLKWSPEHLKIVITHCISDASSFLFIFDAFILNFRGHYFAPISFFQYSNVKIVFQPRWNLTRFCRWESNGEQQPTRIAIIQMFTSEKRFSLIKQLFFPINARL